MQHVIQLTGGAFYAPMRPSIEVDSATKFDSKDEADAFIGRFLPGFEAKSVPVPSAMRKPKRPDTEWIVSGNSTVNWIILNLKRLEDEFAEASRVFCHMTEKGGGVNNIHMLQQLRSLQFLYLDIAAHRHALHSAQENLT